MARNVRAMTMMLCPTDITFAGNAQTFQLNFSSSYYSTSCEEYAPGGGESRLVSIELLSKEWKELFWEFTELWLQPDRASNCSSARCCLEIIVNDGRSFLSDHLGSIYEFSLTLRSTSPRLALYKQLAEESLSSFPIDDEDNSITAILTSDGKVDHSYPINQRKSGGNCCWVDTGSMLLFNVPELLSWLDTPSDLRKFFKKPIFGRPNDIWELLSLGNIIWPALLFGKLNKFKGNLYLRAIAEQMRHPRQKVERGDSLSFLSALPTIPPPVQACPAFDNHVSSTSGRSASNLPPIIASELLPRP
ncbi:UDP-glucose:glycoprotein glucosyltransferase [Platanthera guangdongensis]|uniref:UDP-glucose:glycoprotein glucosyltransferase n=1 Tax=Platanthera guangdongensis TaxID=2320717 RepID=A0ABR2MLW3_9ASPA